MFNFEIIILFLLPPAAAAAAATTAAGTTGLSDTTAGFPNASSSTGPAGLPNATSPPRTTGASYATSATGPAGLSDATGSTRTTRASCATSATRATATVFTCSSPIAIRRVTAMLGIVLPPLALASASSTVHVSIGVSIGGFIKVLVVVDLVVAAALIDIA